MRLWFLQLWGAHGCLEPADTRPQRSLLGYPPSENWLMLPTHCSLKKKRKTRAWRVVFGVPQHGRWRQELWATSVYFWSAALHWPYTAHKCLLPGTQELDRMHVPASLHLDSGFAVWVASEACVAVRVHLHYAYGAACSNLRHFVRHLLPCSFYDCMHECYLCLHWLLGFDSLYGSA